MCVAAIEIHPVYVFCKPFVEPFRIKRATTLFIFEVHVRCVDGSATQDPVTA